MSKNLTYLSRRKGLDDNLFKAIGRLAEKDGSPDREDLEALADWFLMGPANVYGAASFYDLTRPENKGKKIHVCNGAACHLAGTQEPLKKALGRYFDETEIGELCCLGRCHENGAFQYQGQNFSAKSGGELAAIFEESITDGQDTYPVTARGAGILTAEFPGLEVCVPVIRRMLADGPEATLAAVRTARLRGRGGAGFPFAVKMETSRNAKSERKFIVCNADEGDPGSYSDRYLLEQRPYAVLLGMLITGFAIGADTGVFYIRAEYPESIPVVSRAIGELQRAGLVGDNILNSGFSFHFRIIKAQGAYVCGEETALLASIEGQRPEVRVRPPFPAEEGLFGYPTLVNNVETLANLCHIVARGGEAFAAIGTEETTGTKLISVDSAFQRPGLYEVDMGTPLSVLVDELAGGFRKPVKALHIGGPLGGIVPVTMVPDLTLDFDSFARAGFLFGHASIIGIPADYPMIDYLKHLFDFLVHESCGRCFPCRLGSVRGQEMIAGAQRGDRLIDPALFRDLLDTLQEGSLCGLGGGMPLPVRNALMYFEEELKPYFQPAPSISTNR